ncbi:MAG: SsrA-binding protein SmpB [Nitrospinota bacterium]
MSRSKSSKASATGGKAKSPTIENRRARFNYRFDDKIEVGIVLKGNEVKSIRDSKVSLVESHARIMKDELWLFHMTINPYQSQNSFESYDPKRPRKLLAKRKEISKLAVKLNAKGYTLIPLRLYFTGGKVKILLGLGEGKREYDKRDSIKRREGELEAGRAMKRRF